MTRLAAALIASALATGAVTFMSIDDAEACSPMDEFVDWSIPADGEVVAPNTRIMLITGGLSYQNKEHVTLTDAEGQEVAGEEQAQSMGRVFTGLREFFPDDPLAEGEYTLKVDYDFEGSENYEITFEVEDFEVQEDSEPVSFEWFHETHDEHKGDTCHMADEIHALVIEPLEEEPDYYEIFFEHSDGSETVHVESADDVVGEVRNYEVVDVECITVVSGWNGVVGGLEDAIQHCEPHKCEHYEGEEPYYLGSTDWDQIDGCEQEEENGEEENGEEENGEEENGEEENEEEENEEEENGEDEVEEGTCSAVGGGGTSLWLLVLMSLGLLRIRRGRLDGQ